MAGIAKTTKRYPSDLTDKEWSAIEPMMPKTAPTGSPRRVDLRDILNAIRSVVRSGRMTDVAGAFFTLANGLWLVASPDPALDVPNPSCCPNLPGHLWSRFRKLPHCRSWPRRMTAQHLVSVEPLRRAWRSWPPPPSYMPCCGASARASWRGSGSSPACRTIPCPPTSTCSRRRTRLVPAPCPCACRRRSCRPNGAYVLSCIDTPVRSASIQNSGAGPGRRLVRVDSSCAWVETGDGDGIRPAFPHRLL